MKKEGSEEAQDKKIADLEARIGELEGLVEEMKKKYLLTYADLENYKKRAAKERQELVQMTSENLLRELLDVKDHLERALEHAKEATDIKPLWDGVELTLNQMRQYLEKFGVSEIQSLGEPFDPARHEAVQEKEGGDFQPGAVVEEYQKGYSYQGRLLRPARVAVAKEKRS